MKNEKLVKTWAKNNEVNLDTISFYCNLEGDSLDCEFGYCDITGIQGNVTDCIALDIKGEAFEFQALDSLVGGALGSLAGAF